MTHEGQSLGQRRAAHARETAMSMSGDAHAKVRIEAKKLPLRVRNAGVVNALLFVRAKVDAAGPLFERLEDWLRREGSLPATRPAGASDLESELLGLAHRRLQWVTEEVVTYANWVNRFWEAERRTAKED